MPASAWTVVTASGEGLGWDTVATVARGRDRYLALGWHYEPNPHIGYNGSPRLWASEDGVFWESLPVPPEFEGTLGPSLSLVAAPSGAFLLLGNSYDGENALRPLVLSSTDGARWQGEPTDLPNELYLTHVVGGRKGYLLAGRDDGPSSLWLSPDGLAWRPVHALTSTDTTSTFITDIAAGDDGFVAVGEAGIRNGDSAFFALASADGSTWFRSEKPFPAERSSVGPAFVAAIGGDWVATLGGGRTKARFWRSPDGLQWERAGVLEHPPAGSSPVLVSAGGQLFYSAWDVPVGEPGGWTSTDGTTWTSLNLGADGVLAGAFHDNRGLLLLGSTMVNEDRADATFWKSAP